MPQIKPLHISENGVFMLLDRIYKLSHLDVVSDVPQGTVLSPLLFLLHINDLQSIVSSKVRLFADDCWTLSLWEAAHSGSGVLVMGQEAAVSGSLIYPGQF